MQIPDFSLRHTREKSEIYQTMTRRSLILALVALFCIQQTLQAQAVPRAIVKGRVLDDSTRASIPLAIVFESHGPGQSRRR